MPVSAIAPTRAVSSSSVEYLVPSGAPSRVRWATVRLVVKPRAPARTPSRTASAIFSSSSAVGASFGSAPRSPIT